jgi:hypothetical protein
MSANDGAAEKRAEKARRPTAALACYANGRLTLRELRKIHRVAPSTETAADPHPARWGQAMSDDPKHRLIGYAIARAPSSADHAEDVLKFFCDDVDRGRVPDQRILQYLAISRNAVGA